MYKKIKMFMIILSYLSKFSVQCNALNFLSQIVLELQSFIMINCTVYYREPPFDYHFLYLFIFLFH